MTKKTKATAATGIRVARKAEREELFLGELVDVPEPASEEDYESVSSRFEGLHNHHEHGSWTE